MRLTSGRSGVLICSGAAAKVSKQHVLTSKRLYLCKHLIPSKPQYLFLVILLLACAQTLRGRGAENGASANQCQISCSVIYSGRKSIT